MCECEDEKMNKEMERRLCACVRECEQLDKRRRASESIALSSAMPCAWALATAASTAEEAPSSSQVGMEDGDDAIAARERCRGAGARTVGGSEPR